MNYWHYSVESSHKWSDYEPSPVGRWFPFPSRDGFYHLMVRMIAVSYFVGASRSSSSNQLVTTTSSLGSDSDSSFFIIRNRSLDRTYS